jgi:hypothetical protein
MTSILVFVETLSSVKSLCRAISLVVDGLNSKEKPEPYCIYTVIVISFMAHT